MGETIKVQRGEATYLILLNQKNQSDIQSNHGSSNTSRSSQRGAHSVNVMGMKRTQTGKPGAEYILGQSLPGQESMPSLFTPVMYSQSDNRARCRGSLNKGTAIEVRVGTGPAGTVPYFPHNCHQFSLCSSSHSGSARSSKATAINS